MNKNQKKSMKKNCALLAGALITGLWALPASAAEQYLSGNIGMTWTNDIHDGTSSYGMDSGTNLLIATGIDDKFRDYRFEGEFGYQTCGVNSLTSPVISNAYRGDVHVLSLLANGYYDVYNGDGFKPYLMAGAGAVIAKFDDLRLTTASSGSGHDEHETTFAYQIGVGVAVPITPDMKFDARYRYFSTANFRLDDGNMTHLSSCCFLLGLRFRL